MQICYDGDDIAVHDSLYVERHVSLTNESGRDAADKTVVGQLLDNQPEGMKVTD
jgi:hypothetical protein